MSDWQINKSITFVFALVIVITPMIYSAFLIGTMAHELTHARHSTDMTLIKINYDLSGEAYGDFMPDDTEDRAYLIGAIITSSIYMLLVVAGFIVIENIKRCKNG